MQQRCAAGLLLSAVRAKDIDSAGRLAAAAPQHGAQQQMRRPMSC